MFLEVAQIVAASVYTYGNLFSTEPKKSGIFFGYLYLYTYLLLKLSKIVQSGHTGSDNYLDTVLAPCNN